MLNAGHAGFVHAPVTKVIISTVVLTTVFGSIIESRTRLTLNLTSVIKSHQFWRLLTHHFVCSTPGELLFGTVLIYFFRQYERQLGSSKFSSIIFLSSTIYTILLLLYLNYLPQLIAPASGPYSCIFMILLYFMFETPKIYHLQVLGLFNLSDKTFPYLILIQLLLSSPPSSFVSSFFAIIAALICRFPFISTFCDWPQPIISMSSNYILPYIGTTPRPSTVSAQARRNRAAARYARVTAAVNGLLEAGARQQELHQTTEQGTADSGTGHIGDGSGVVRGDNDDVDDHLLTTTSLPVIVSSEHVATLVDMGFETNDVVSALRQANNDLQVATEYLLRSSAT